MGKPQVRSSASDSGLASKLRVKSSLDDINNSQFWRAVLAELVGTLLFVFVGLGSTIKGSDEQIALCFGLGVATIVWSIAHISGGHINPAVTLGMLIARRISLIRAISYTTMQMVGSLASAVILKSLVPLKNDTSISLLHTGVTGLHEDVDPAQGVGIELLITFVLVFTVFATCDSKREDLKGSGPLAIGLSVTLCHLAFIPFTGASMNPARSFGPAVVYSKMKNHWVYWIGPLLGGALAAPTYEFIFAANASITRTTAWFCEPNYNGADFLSPQEQGNSNELINISKNEQECNTLLEKATSPI